MGVQTVTQAPDTAEAASDARYAMTSATASVLTQLERSASGIARRLAWSFFRKAGGRASYDDLRAEALFALTYAASMFQDFPVSGAEKCVQFGDPVAH